MAGGNDNKGRGGNSSGNKGNKYPAGPNSNTPSRGMAGVDEEKQKETATDGGDVLHGSGRERAPGSREE